MFIVIKTRWKSFRITNNCILDHSYWSC